MESIGLGIGLILAGIAVASLAISIELGKIRKILERNFEKQEGK